MAYNLCSSPSSLCSSLSSSQTLKTINFNYSPKLVSLPSHSPHCLQITRVSVQNPIPQETHTQNASEQRNPKRLAWVNPRSRRIRQLREKSNDARYNALAEIAESLNACDSVEGYVFEVLSRYLGDKIVVQHDAAVVLNNLDSPETAMLALRFFQGNMDLNKETILYNVVLKVCRKSKDLVRVEKVFDEMLERGVKPDNITFSTLISCASVCLFPEKAGEWFEKMPTLGCDPDCFTFASMIDVYAKAGSVEKALSLYDRMRAKNWQIDVATFGTLIRMYGAAGNFDGCLNMYEEMKALGVKPNLFIYNTLLINMGRANRPWQAKYILKEMSDNGFSPDWTTYRSLLQAYTRSRYGHHALAVYKEMKEKGVELNVRLYNAVLSMCADMGLYDDALEVFADMKSSETCKPDSWTYSSMITVHSCSGEVSKAEAVLNEMLEADIKPTIFIYTSLIQCYGKAKRIDDAVKTYNKLLELGMTPDDRFCCCILGVMKQTPKEELTKLVSCLEKGNPKLYHVVKLLVEQDGGEKFKEEAAALFASSSDDAKKPFCNCLIDICVNLELLERGSELLYLGLEHGIYRGLQLKSPTQWSLYLKSLSYGAALAALHVWFNDLLEAVDSGEELPPLLGINTGHGNHRYSDESLATVFESHLKELNAPFYEAEEKSGWFLCTNVAAKLWLKDRHSAPDLVAA